jgi:3D (Asp-Asp-Asp) domain-containing protein
MRDKLIDGLLLITMIAVAILIVFTLFSPSSLKFDFSRAKNTILDKTTTEQNASNAVKGNVIPVSPDGTESSQQTGNGETLIVPILPDETLIESQQATGLEPETTQDATSQETEVSEIVPVSEGNLVLERIGFSFVTGGAGACSIVLQPWRHIAVSRDILATYPCGSEVTINLDETVGGRKTFRAVVADTMNPVHKKTVNIYVGQEEPALSYGVRAGTLEP